MKRFSFAGQAEDLATQFVLEMVGKEDEFLICLEIPQQSAFLSHPRPSLGNGHIR